MATRKKTNESAGTPAVSHVSPEIQGTGMLAPGVLNAPNKGTPAADPEQDNPFGEFRKTIRTDALLLVLKMLENGQPKEIIASVRWLESNFSRDFSDIELHLAYAVASQIANNSITALIDFLLNDEFKRLHATGLKKKWAKTQAEKRKGDRTTPFETLLKSNPHMSKKELVRQLESDGVTEPVDGGYRIVTSGKIVKDVSMDAKLSRLRKGLQTK